MSFFSWLGKVVEEAPGVPSTMRVIYMVITVMVAVVPMSLWAYLSIKTGTMVDFPGGVITMATLLFSAASGAKVIQQRGE